MAATKYTYSISTDFSAGVATSKLGSEIQASAIVTALDYINTSGDDCDIWFKDALSTGDETALDGLVAAHDGVEVPDVQPAYNSAGAQIMSNTYATFEEDAAFHGIRQECPANTISFNDVLIDVELYLDHLMAWFKDANDGDIVELSAVDKDDVLGLFATYGLTVGEDVLELKKWGTTIPMFPGDTPWISFNTPDSAPLMAGLYIRVKYENNHDTQAATMGMVFSWFRS